MTDSGAERAARRIAIPEARLKEHAIQLGAIGMAGISQPLWETRQKLMNYLEENVFPDVAAIIREETGTQDVAWKVKYAIAKVRAKRGKAMSGHDDEGWWNTADEMEQAVLAVLPAAPDEGGKR